MPDTVFQYNGLLNGVSLNEVTGSGYYLISGPVTDLHPDAPSNGFIEVENFNNGSYVRQTHRLRTTPAVGWARTIRPFQSPPVYFPWDSIGVGTDPAPLVLVGDSNVELTGLAKQMSARLGRHVIKGGFGGTRMGRHSDPNYNKLSMCKWTAASINGNWSEQQAAVAALAAQGDDNTEALNNLMGIDWSGRVDVAVMAGRNDWSGGNFIGLPTDTGDDTFCGAFNITVQNLLAPRTPANSPSKVRVAFLSPIWGTLAGDSGENQDEDSGHTLPEFVDATLAQARRHNTPAFDFYHNSGIGPLTRHLLDSAGTHMTAEGSLLGGDRAAGFMKAIGF